MGYRAAKMPPGRTSERPNGLLGLKTAGPAGEGRKRPTGAGDGLMKGQCGSPQECDVEREHPAFPQLCCGPSAPQVTQSRSAAVTRGACGWGWRGRGNLACPAGPRKVEGAEGAPGCGPHGQSSMQLYLLVSCELPRGACHVLEQAGAGQPSGFGLNSRRNPLCLKKPLFFSSVHSGPSLGALPGLRLGECCPQMTRGREQ